MTMRGHGAHMWMCGAMIAVALVVVAATGNAFLLLPALGCVAMMGMMMWMMGRMMSGQTPGHSSDAHRNEK